MFVRYPFGTKGYKVLNIATKRIHVSRDVVFHEDVFPFSLISKSNKVFPSFPQANTDLTSDFFPPRETVSNSPDQYHNIVSPKPSHRHLSPQSSSNKIQITEFNHSEHLSPNNNYQESSPHIDSSNSTGHQEHQLIPT